MNAAELAADYARGMRKVFGASRGDERYLHVADIKDCQIKVRARLRGKSMIAFSADKLAMFQLGHAGEALFLAALQPELEAKGYAVETDVLFFLSVSGDNVWAGRLKRDVYPERLVADNGALLIPARTIVGHADIVATHPKYPPLVFEAKTEKGKARDVPSWFWQIQAATYAIMAAGGKVTSGPTVVGATDRRNGEYVFYDIDVERMRAEVLALARGVLAVYNADPPADTQPPFGWMCKSCDFGGCDRNANAERKSLEGVF